MGDGLGVDRLLFEDADEAVAGSGRDEVGEEGVGEDTLGTEDEGADPDAGLFEGHERHEMHYKKRPSKMRLESYKMGRTSLVLGLLEQIVDPATLALHDAQTAEVNPGTPAMVSRKRMRMSHWCGSMMYPPARRSATDMDAWLGGRSLCLYPDTRSKPRLRARSGRRRQ